MPNNYYFTNKLISIAISKSIILLDIIPRKCIIINQRMASNHIKVQITSKGQFINKVSINNRIRQRCFKNFKTHTLLLFWHRRTKIVENVTFFNQGEPSLLGKVMEL
ncbi:hypothetical protein V6Z11_D08G091900 [Gossypium hirsutum]